MLRLKEIREEKGLYQKDIARYLNKTVTCICDWERGRTEPGIDDLIRIADFFDINVDYLIGHENCTTEKIEIGDVQLTSEEQQLVDLYRALPTRDRAELVGFAKGLAY